jgi:hypothetical protein
MRLETAGSLSLRLAFALALAVAWGCGGGGGGGVTPPPSTATFTPYASSPANLSVTMQAGEASGETFEVRIAVTGVNDFFGAGFHVLYDPADVEYVSAEDGTSFLWDGGATCDFLYQDSGGDVAVAATRRQNQAGTIPGVNVTGTRDLVVLTFRALRSVTGSVLEFGTPREVRDSAQPAPGNAIAVTWAGGTLTAR